MIHQKSVSLTEGPGNYLDTIMSHIHVALFKTCIYWKPKLGKGFPTHTQMVSLVRFNCKRKIKSK